MSVGPSVQGTVPLQGLSSQHQCEGTTNDGTNKDVMYGICSPMLIPRQLRFSLYSGAVITEDLM